MRRLLILGLVCFLPLFGFAATKDKTIKVQLILDHIEMIKAQETGGDELYLSMSIAKKDRPTEYLRIPEAPIHWLSDKVGQLKNVPLYSQELASGTTVAVITSLIDEDLPYWNIDDLLGSVRVRIKNEHGKLMTSWDMPNQTTENDTKQPSEHLGKNTNKIQKFDITGDGAHYVLFFSLSSSSQIRR